MVLSRQDLVHLYRSLFNGRTGYTEQVDSTAQQQVYAVLAMGFTDQQIERELVSYASRYPDRIPGNGDLQKFFSNRTPSPINLLNPYQMYYHNQLRIVPPAPVVDIDIESGALRVLQPEYYMEIRASYTVQDLTAYFLSTVPCSRGIELRMEKAFDWLLNQYDIDTLLFTIDAMAIYRSQDTVVSATPLDLQDYVAAGTDMRNTKITELKLLGKVEEVPRKR